MRREIGELKMVVDTISPFKHLNVADKENEPNGLLVIEEIEERSKAQACLVELELVTL
jgi:hypothetical protein